MWPVADSVRWPDADGQQKHHVLEWTIWFECGRSRSVWLNSDWRPCLLHHPNFYLFVTPAVSRLLSSQRLLSTFPLVRGPVRYNLSGTRNNFRVENKMWPKMNYSSLKITRSVVPPARPAHCCRLGSVNLEFWAAGLGAKLSSARREHSISLEASGPCNATFISKRCLYIQICLLWRQLVAWNCVDSLFIVNLRWKDLWIYTLCYVTRYMFVVQVMSGWYYDQAKTIQCADMIFKIN